MKSKKMKQGMSWLLCMVMLLSNNVTVLADETDSSGEGQTQDVSAEETEASTEEAGVTTELETEETVETTEQTEPVEEEQPVYNEAVQLRHEFKDENGNVISVVTADIQEGSFEADASAISMEVDTLTEEEDSYMQGLIRENLPEYTYLGDYVLYDVVFKVNGELTDPMKEIKLTYEGTGIDVQDIQDAVVCQYNVADPEVTDDKDSVTEIIQRDDMIRYMEENGEDTSKVDDHDLSEVVLNENGAADQISMEVRKSSIFGCYVEELSQETAFSQEVNGTTITVTAPEGAFPMDADQVSMAAAPLSEEQAAAVEEQLSAQAESQGQELKGYAAYDISLWANGEEIQPQKPVTVTMENTGLDVAETLTAFQVSDEDNSVSNIGSIDENGTVSMETAAVLPAGTAAFGEPEVQDEETVTGDTEQTTDETGETADSDKQDEISGEDENKEDTAEEEDKKTEEENIKEENIKDEEKDSNQTDAENEEDAEKETAETGNEKENIEKEETKNNSEEAVTTDENTDDEENNEKEAETIVSEPVTLTEEKGGVTVILTAPEGAFPVDSNQVSMTVEELTEEQKAIIEEQLQAQADENGQELKGYVAYDITLWANGEIIQPQVPVTVTFENAELDVENAEVTEGFQLDEETETLNNIEGSVEEDGSAVVEAEHFTPTGVGSFGAPEESSKVPLEDNSSNTVDYSCIADDYNTDNANEWQIVSEQFNGQADDQYTVTEDGMLRLQKKVIPTGTENEFYVYLNMEPVMSWKDVFMRSTMWLCGNNKEIPESDVEGINNDSTIDDIKKIANGQVSKVVDINEPLTNKNTTQPDKEVIVNTIRLETASGTYEEIPVSMHYGLSQNSFDSFTIIFCAPGSKYAVKLSDVSMANGVLTIPAEAWGSVVSGGITGDLSLLTGEVTPKTVTDPMGGYIEYDQTFNIVTSNSTAKYDPETDTITWDKFSELEESDDENDYAVYNGNYYRKNAYQLIYKIRLKVEQDGFNSCAEYIENKESTPEDYRYETNGTTTVEYSYTNENDETVSDHENFTVPQVRGLLYNIEFQKVDSDGNALPDAIFSLTGSYAGQNYNLSETSGEDGYVKFRNLPYGTYALKETQAPGGYLADYTGESVTVCYTTDASKLRQDHEEPHSCDDKNDVKNMLYKDVGTNGQITNKLDEPDPGEDPDNPTYVPHQKQIDWLGDSVDNLDTDLEGAQYYRLYLDATGIPDRIPEGADIVFILDTSNSMNFNMDGTQGDLWDEDKDNNDVEAGTRRLDYVKSAAVEAISTIKEASNQAAPINIGVVTFNYGNGKHYHEEHKGQHQDQEKWYGYHKGTKIFSDFTKDYDTLISEIEALDLEDLDGRTNYEAAFSAADTLLESSTQDNKYIVFITDGETNGYTSGGTGFDGSGVDLNRQTEEFVNISSNGQAIREANNIARQWENLSGFYTIAVSTDVNTENLKKLGPDGVLRLDIQADNENAIHDAFNSVISAITKQVCDVTITDELSQYVEFVNHKGITLENKENISADDIALKVTKTVNGQPEDIDPSNYTAEIKIENGKQSIAVNFGQDYFLEPGAKYTISFNVKLTQEAYSAVEDKTGDPGTDYTGTNNQTSAGKAGLHSNAEATITYSTMTAGKLKEYKRDYPKPVVQKPEVSTVQVKKIVDGTVGNETDEFIINVTSTNDFSAGLVLGNGESKQMTFEGQSIQLTVNEIVPMEYDFFQIKVQDLNTEKYISEKLTNGTTITVAAGSNLLIEVHNKFTHTNYFHDKSSADNNFATGEKTIDGAPNTRSAEIAFLKPDPVIETEGGDGLDEIL